MTCFIFMFDNYTFTQNCCKSNQKSLFSLQEKKSDFLKFDIVFHLMNNDYYILRKKTIHGHLIKQLLF